MSSGRAQPACVAAITFPAIPVSISAAAPVLTSFRIGLLPLFGRSARGEQSLCSYAFLYHQEVLIRRANRAHSDLTLPTCCRSDAKAQLCIRDSTSRDGEFQFSDDVVQVRDEFVDVGHGRTVIDNGAAYDGLAIEQRDRWRRAPADMKRFHDAAIVRISIAAVDVETDDVELNGRCETEAFAVLQPHFQMFCGEAIFQDGVSQSVRAKVLQRHPDLQRATTTRQIWSQIAGPDVARGAPA